MVDFKKVIERIKSITGSTQKEIASEIFGVSDKNLSNKIRRGSIDLDALIHWSGNTNVDLGWLLTGQGSSPSNMDGPKPPVGDDEIQALFGIPESRSGPPNVIEIDSGNSIRQLIDKFFASDINKEFVDIERLSPAQYREFVVYVKGMARGMELSSKSNAGSDRRKIERRTKDQPAKYPKDQDRRSGSDRRRAYGGK